MSLASFPAEMLNKIALECDPDSLIALDQSCPLMREVVRNPSFAREYWTEQRLKEPVGEEPSPFERLQEHISLHLCTEEEFRDQQVDDAEEMKEEGNLEGAYNVLRTLLCFPVDLRVWHSEWMEHQAYSAETLDELLPLAEQALRVQPDNDLASLVRMLRAAAQ